jgi:hypothetical protein
MEKQPSELPATEASFFLSFSSKTVMLARQITGVDLSNEAERAREKLRRVAEVDQA